MIRTVNITLTKEEIETLKATANLLLDIKEEADKAIANNTNFKIDGIEEDMLVQILNTYVEVANNFKESKVL